ncbi:Lipase class 3 family protein [Spironucleus salmonicida]|uniref:sn-1-specific diacylglycerol lipase n=1 Tax=Spironucleus salmonicida TaxID=348837 RepID=V6LBJ3_9EUKA|nr:Lipase class 3 family protein [Spironucleus salmonicida]|eukprot:EST41782.1 Lipase class 3 family protein [Spironucleus salmonicida]
MKESNIGKLLITAIKNNKIKQNSKQIIQEMQIFLKNIKNTNKSIASNYKYFPQYFNDMKHMSSECILFTKKEITISQYQLQELLTAYNFCDMLYGVTNPTNKDKRQINPLKMSLIEDNQFQKFIISNLQPFNVHQLIKHNFHQSDFYSPVFICFTMLNKIYIIIRGTFSLKDVFADMFATIEEINGYNLHKGFGLSALFLYNNLINIVKNQDVVIIGHSYGAAIAAILSIFIKNDVKSLSTIGFGCPPCLPINLIDQLSMTTVLYENDPVPFMSVRCLEGLDKRLCSVAQKQKFTKQERETKPEDMLIPGTIYHAFKISGEIQWFQTRTQEYSELILKGIIKNWKNHLDYFDVLRVVAQEGSKLLDCQSEIDDEDSIIQNILEL